MKRLILVDACNLFHRLPGYRDRLAQGMDLLADQLLGQIRCLHDLEHWELHLIIDGKGSRLEQLFPDANRTLSLVFSASGQSADTIIETWLLRLGQDWSVKVASEDRAVAHSAMAYGADVLKAQDLMDWAGRVRQRFANTNQRLNKNSISKFGNRLEGLP